MTAVTSNTPPTSSTIQINGASYAVAQLSDVARAMLGNIEVTDQKIASLQQELALFQVAREAFGNNLLAHLPAPLPAA